MNDDNQIKRILSRLPSVNTLLQHPVLAAISDDHPRAFITDSVRFVLNEVRSGILGRSDPPADISEEALVQKVIANIGKHGASTVRPVINATGIVLHDAVRAAMVTDAARNAMIEALHPGISDTETRAEKALCEITGADAACLLHSDLAALWVAIDTFGRGMEVVISRSHMGAQGTIRMMDLFDRCGVHVIEVGATNKTHLKDYRAALDDRTGAIVSIQPATYAFRGFAQDVAPEDLAALGTKYDVPVLLAAGLTTLTAPPVSSWQPALTLEKAVRSGVSITLTGSGLTGAPPCGIAIGQSAMIVRMKQNPMAHFQGVGPAVYAGMEAALQSFDFATAGLDQHPAGRMILASSDHVRAKAERLMNLCCAELGHTTTLDLIETTSHLTGVRLPSESLPGYGISIRPDATKAASLSKLFYKCTPVLLTNFEDDRIILDLRTVEDTEVETVSRLLTSVLKNTCI